MNLQQAGHLLRRTTFGFTPARLQQAVAEGAEKTIDRLLAMPPDYASFDQSAAALTSRESSLQDAANLWLYRILNTPHPLLEKMTLFWRDYFRVQSLKFLQHLREPPLSPIPAGLEFPPIPSPRTISLLPTRTLTSSGLRLISRILTE